jgi:hypothetical protein
MKERDLLVERSRWEDNVKIDLKINGWKTWIGFMWLKIMSSDSCVYGN